MPDETPVDLAAHLAKLARDARDRLPSIVARIEEIVRAVDPIELLSQLSILNLTHPAGVMPDRDDKARWQVRIEWLAWLILARQLEAPVSPQVIDSRALTPLEEALDDYFNAVTLSLHVSVDGLTADEDRLRASLQLEALVVRGLGFQKDLQGLSEDLYSPHDDWCLANVGLTVRDAFSVAKAVGALYTAKVSNLRRDAAAVEATVRENPARAAELEEIPPTVRDALRDGGTPATNAEQFAHAIRGLWFFSQSAALVSFAPDDVHGQLGGMVPVERVVAFFNLLSASAETVKGEPNPVALSPLAFAPFVRRGNRFFLFVPPLLYEGIFFAFHRRLYADEIYRSRYDKARADWLEVAALDALRGVLPGAESGWSLEYGPRRERTELDGLVLYDGRLLLMECKWKSPTLAALRGDMGAIASDFRQAILSPLAQAKRARNYILGRDEAEFIEKGTGRRIVIRREDLAETILVTVVGSGAWSHIAANLAEFAPAGTFAHGELPWALSLQDLRAVTHSMELPSQLFDYLRRRREIQRDGRFHFHDEWDLLGVYLHGALDPLYPKFQEAAEKGVQGITLDGFDDELQDYYYSLSSSMAPREKPRRTIPARIHEILLRAERSGRPGRTVAICSVLTWPDEELQELDKALDVLRGKTILDGKAHAAVANHPWRPHAVALACGHKNRRAIQETLRSAVISARTQAGAIECVGIEWDLASSEGPVLASFGSEHGR